MRVIAKKNCRISLVLLNFHILKPKSIITMTTTICRCLFFSLFFIYGQFAIGQTATTAKPQVLTLNHIAVHVNNLEKSTAFYE